MQNLLTQIFLNNENQRKSFYLFQSTQHETTNYFHKNSFFLSKTSNATKTNFTSKEIFIFFYLYKVFKTTNKANFETYKNLRKNNLKIY